MESVNQMSDYVNKGLDFVNKNKILSSVLSMLLVLYAAAAAPKLPTSVVKVFDNSLFKLGFMFMIAYLATKDPSVAIITAIALLVTIQTLSSREAAESVVKSASKATAKSQPAVKIVKQANNTVAVKEAFAEEEDMRIPLSPSRAEFIEECTKRANAHYGAAAKAESEGQPALAEAHKQEAAKQEIKIDAVVAAKQHTIAAAKAESEGKPALAEAHMEEAAKQETKAVAIVKSEAHVAAAEEAKASGNIALAEAHMEEASKQEAAVVAIVKSEAHTAAAEEAIKRGAVAEAESHRQAAVAEEAKAFSMVKAEAEMARKQVQPERVVVETEITGFSVPHGEVEHASVFSESQVAQTRPEARAEVRAEVRAEAKKPTSCSAPFDIEGYSGDSFAEI